jgi:hypothetical protein
VLPLGAALVVGAGGCPLTGMMQQADVAQNAASAAQAHAVAAEQAKRGDYFVTAAELWLCPTADQARANKTCAAGKQYRHNHSIKVIGAGPADGLWKSEFWDAKGQHAGFVLASGVNELPDMSGLEAFARDVDSRYPTARRIPIRTVTYENLVSQPDAFRGFVLVLRQPSRDLRNRNARDDQYSFTIPIPAESNVPALAQFELKNRGWVQQIQAGERSYECGPGYCDEMVIVAELSGRTVDRPDQYGQLHRLPVFTVIEMGDRYGASKRDGP